MADLPEANKKLATAYNNKALTQIDKKDYSGALENLDKAIKLDPLDPTAYFNRAFSFIEIKNENYALKDFKSCSNITTNNKLKALAYAHMGEIYDRRREDSLSIHYFNLAIKTDSLSAYAFNKRGAYFLNRNKIDYAFFYLRYDENQEWYDGSWWLVIASEEIDHDFDGIGKVLSVIKLLDIDLPEFDFVIEKPYLEEHKRIWDRIDIKVYPE